MKITDLIGRICMMTGWNLTRVHQEAGVSERTSHMKRTKAEPAKESFDLKLLRLACRTGAIGDALAILFDPQPVPIALLAAAMYHDITGIELHGILSADASTCTNHPDPAERVSAIMTALRAASSPSPIIVRQEPQSAEAAREESLRQTDDQQ